MRPIITAAIALSTLLGVASCDRSNVREKEAALQAQQRTIDSMNNELAKKRIIDSMNEVVNTQYVLTPPLNAAAPAMAPSYAGVAATSTQRSSTRNYSSRALRRARSTSSSSSNNTASQSQPVVYQEAPVQQKRGWSGKAKGAVIGAATGAAAGAIINKRNRGAGAIIGGVLGAGAGTGVGAVIDKKQGR